MSETTLPDYQQVVSVLQNANLQVTPAEMHGLLSGMLCGGLSLQDKSWQPMLFDYTNQGMGWPMAALQAAESALQVSVTQVTGTDMEFTLLLPDDAGEEGVFDLADAVSDWVNHFISGLGLVKNSLKNISAESKEALGDLEEIARLGIDEDDDLEEQGQLLIQVIEHIKACVLIIHAEFGDKPTQENAAPTIH